MNAQEKKKLKSATASVTAIALLLTGTFAWNAFDQEALNKTIGLSDNAGARLHDDFDGTNKDVYIENYGDEGQDLVYARIRLDEYMEVGTGAGTGATGLDVLRGDKAKEGVSTPSVNDVSTWDTYLYGSTSTGTDIRKYRDLEFGGSTIYMPTFNKNADSLAADINGTLEGPDGDMFTDADAYLDYETFTDGQERTQDAIYDIDDNDLDEGSASVEGTNHMLEEETHTAKSTLDAEVMSMDTWKTDKNAQPGEYWVYDTDGWAYWAQPIEPQTATGLLLTGIVVNENPSGEWFYAINVVSQIATAGDWGSAEAGTGFYEGGSPSEDALGLLDRVAGLLEVDVDLNITTGQADLQVGESTTMTASITVPSGYESQDGVNWSITERTKSSGLEQSEIDATLVNGKFTPVAAMKGNSYVVTVTSEINFNATSSIILNVYDINDTDAVSISIAAAGDATELLVGESLQFTGKVDGLVDTSIKWSVTGGSGTTAISESGLLTVDASESIGATLTVKVEANANSTLYKELDITTTFDISQALGNIEPGSSDKTTIDNIEWYVLDSKTDDEGREMVLILSAGIVGSRTYHSSNDSTWSTSTLRTYLNGDFITSKIPSLADNIVETELQTALVTNASGNYETTVDKVFILTQEDYGWTTSASTGTSSFPTEADALVSSDLVAIGSTYWLRSPGSAAYSRSVYPTGYLLYDYASSSIGVRPALWIYL